MDVERVTFDYIWVGATPSWRQCSFSLHFIYYVLSASTVTDIVYMCAESYFKSRNSNFLPTILITDEFLRLCWLQYRHVFWKIIKFFHALRRKTCQSAYACYLCLTFLAQLNSTLSYKHLLSCVKWFQISVLTDGKKWKLKAIISADPTLSWMLTGSPFGPFPSGTAAYLECTSGYSQGSTFSRCTNGQWNPSALGTCASSVGIGTGNFLVLIISSPFKNVLKVVLRWLMRSFAFSCSYDSLCHSSWYSQGTVLGYREKPLIFSSMCGLVRGLEPEMRTGRRIRQEVHFKDEVF